MITQSVVFLYSLDSLEERSTTVMKTRMIEEWNNSLTILLVTGRNLSRLLQ